MPVCGSMVCCSVRAMRTGKPLRRLPSRRVVRGTRCDARTSPRLLTSLATPPCDITLCVVLLSEEAAAAPGFLERANALAEHMPATIPVRLDGLTPERCGAPGSPIRERHWADARNHPSIWQEIFHSHVWLYPAYDDLAARTARWETCGRDDSFLMQSVNQAKQACALIDEMHDDSFQRPSDAMVRYAHASHTFARRQRKRTRRHSLVLVAAIAAAVATVVIVRGVVAAHVEHAVQSAQSAYSMRLETDPAFFSFQAYCAMRDAGGVEPEQVHALTAGLERPWAMGILGTEDFNAGGWQGEGAFAQTGAQYWVRADGGALQRWNILAFEPVSTIRVSSSNAFVFDVTADGAAAVVADADGVAMIDLKTGERTALDAACTDSVAIACSEDGSQIAVQTASAIAVYENGARAREIDLAGTDVLALTRTAAGLRALRATSAEAAGTATTAEETAVEETVQLIDLTMGEVVAQAPLPAAEILTGTILPAGEALVCSNGTVSRLSAASALEPVGFTTRDAPSAPRVGRQRAGGGHRARRCAGGRPRHGHGTRDHRARPGGRLLSFHLGHRRRGLRKRLCYEHLVAPADCTRHRHGLWRHLGKKPPMRQKARRRSSRTPRRCASRNQNLPWVRLEAHLTRPQRQSREIPPCQPLSPQRSIYHLLRTATSARQPVCA